jgi:thiol-disulfide isomerase/thioredoxin
VTVPRLSLVALVLVLATGVGPATPALGQEVTLSAPDGHQVGWTELVAERGPMAVLFWASWLPKADATLDRVDALAAAARERGLDFLVIAVQEPLDDARGPLGGIRVDWLHDRHGRLLKRYRVVSIPRLLIVDPNGEARASLEPDPTALRDGGSR